MYVTDTQLAASDGASLVGYVQSGADALPRTVEDRLRERLSLLDFIPVGLHADILNRTSATDISSYLQNALDEARASGKSLFAPAGTYVWKNPVYYYNLDTDADVAPALVFSGDGMGRTIFDCSDWQGGAHSSCLTVSNDPSIPDNNKPFLKGGALIDFTIFGTPGVLHNGVKLQSCWYTTLCRLRIKYCGQGTNSDLSSGAALLVGAELSESSGGDGNPDWTSVSFLTIVGCEFDQNGIGILNIANNNANGVTIVDTSIRSNSRGGVQFNGSYWVFGPSTAIAYNGIEDSANAFGGVRVSEVASTTFSVGYRPKGVEFIGEFDTNYPHNIALLRGEGVAIRSTTISFSDAVYTTGQWGARGITAFPAAQIVIGGTSSADQVYDTLITKSVRPSIQHVDGHLPAPGGGHAMIHVQPYGVGTRIEDCRYNLDVDTWTAWTNYVILRESSKAGTSPDFSAHKYHTWYEWPRTTLGEAQYQSLFDVPYKRVFTPDDRANFEFAFDIPNGAARTFRIPYVVGESDAPYGMVFVTANGQPGRTAIIAYRDAAALECFSLGASAGDMTFGTTALTGSTGPAGKLNVAVAGTGLLYVENRLGAARRMIVRFFNAPGALNQLAS